MELDRVSPADGGCWYCYKDTGQMVFSFEFDCFLHLECLRKQLNLDGCDPEAAIFAEEFEELLTEKSDAKP